MSKFNNKNIYFREIESKDYKDIEKIISDTWGYEKLSSNPVNAKRMARLYLRSCLTVQTFTRVAIHDGQVIGIIMARSEKDFKHPKLSYSIKQLYAYLLVNLTKEGRKICRMYKGIDKIDEELLEATGQKFDGELVFFALDKKARGLGIGKHLLNLAKDYMLSNNMNNFYLYTDVSCNYEFYENQGFSRIGEKQYTLKPKYNFDFLFFIYKYNLKV